MKLLFLDFETAWSEDYSLSLKSMTTQKYIHDERFKVHGVGLSRLNAPGQWVTGTKCAAVLGALVPQSIVVCQNAAFDVGILSFHYGLRPGGVIDTESLSRAMIGGSLKSHGLDAISKLLLGVGKGFGLASSKGLWDLPPHVEKELADYCVYLPNSDIELTKGIFKKLIRFFPQEELSVVDWCARAFSEPSLILNSEVLTCYHAEVVEKKAEALRSAGLEDRALLMSNPQYAAALEALGVVVPTKISPATGKESFAFAKTDEGHKALLEHENPQVQALVAARLEVKSTIEETRAAKYLEASRFGPWPVHYKFSGADQTHRLSGSDGAGGNPQNLKRGGVLRDAIEAPPGYQLVVADLSQIEARITMGLAGETDALDAFRAVDRGEGQDVYCWFGEKLYGRPISKKENPLERQIAKSGFLGCGFGAGNDGLKRYANGQGIAMNDEEAAATVTVYRNTFPGVCRLWRIFERRLPLMAEGKEDTFPAMKPVFTTGHEPLLGVPGFRLLDGLWVKFPNLRLATEDNCSDKMKEKLVRFRGKVEGWIFDSGRDSYSIWGGGLVENGVQFLARKIAMEKTAFLKSVLKIAMSSHDEAVAVVPTAKVEAAEAVMRKIMSTSPTWWSDLPLAAEVSSGRTYGEAKQ